MYNNNLYRTYCIAENDIVVGKNKHILFGSLFIKHKYETYFLKSALNVRTFLLGVHAIYIVYDDNRPRAEAMASKIAQFVLEWQK